MATLDTVLPVVFAVCAALSNAVATVLQRMAALTVPSSQGAVVDRDELRFRLSRAFSPRVSGFVAARGIRTEGLDETSTGTQVRTRKYYTGRTGFEWRMNRQYALLGAYEFKWQEYEGEPNDATSNGVTLSVVYQPRRLK